MHEFFLAIGQSPVRLFVVAQLLILLAFAWKDFPVWILLTNLLFYPVLQGTKK